MSGAESEGDGWPADLAALAEAGAGRPVWGRQTADLNLNLVVLEGDGAIGEHVNAEVEVLILGIAGCGDVEVDGETHTLRPRQAIVIPRGARRAMRAAGGRFAYLTCHRRRPGLWPRGMGPRGMKT
jgi:quercetin dioxygenase-like cupin family protein